MIDTYQNWHNITDEERVEFFGSIFGGILGGYGGFRVGWSGMKHLKKGSATGSAGCFLAGTLVAAASGMVPIEQVQQGDEVWSYNHETEQWELREVERVFEHEYFGDIVSLTIQHEGGSNETIEATGGHLFWVVEGEGLADRPAVRELPAAESVMTPTGRWTEARWLRLGDKFLTKTGTSATVVGLTIRMERVKVYNLQVKNLQLYAVGQAGVLVHNSALESFAVRAKRLGWVENPNRPGSWGIYRNGRFVERGRIDPATPGAPGWGGKDHIHIDGCKKHLPLDTPLPGE